MTILKMTTDAFEKTRRTPWTIGRIVLVEREHQSDYIMVYYIELGTYGIRVTHYYSNWNAVTNFWTYGEYGKFFDVPFEREFYTTE